MAGISRVNGFGNYVVGSYRSSANIGAFLVTVKNASGVSPNRSEIIAYNAWDWAQAIWQDMLS